MKFTLTHVFTQTFDAVLRTKQFVSSCGGTRSGKTFAMLQVLYILVAQDDERNIASINSVVSQTFPHLEKGAITDFRRMLGNAFRDEWWNESKHTYTFPSGAKIEFFSADNENRVHGPARDRLFVNEAQTMKWDTVRQLLTRTKGIALFDYNPTHEFWLNTDIESLEECITIHSTYLDNTNRETNESMLSESQIRFIESQKKSASWWRVYGLGLRGQLDGLIYPEFTQIDEMPDDNGHLLESFGMDFGYNDPTTLVRILADRKQRIAYIDELMYESHLRNKQVADKMCAMNIAKDAVIFADCANPTSISEVNFEGKFSIKPCNKTKSVVEQIQFVQGWTLCVTKRSLNVVRELNNYQWKKDANGRTLNEVDKDAHQDHTLDAIRYALFTRFGTFKKQTRGGYPSSVNAW